MARRSHSAQRSGRSFVPSSPGAERCLDSGQLARIELAFDSWVHSARGPAVRFSRERVRLIFLLIRHTGARLSEVLYLDPLTDVDTRRRTVTFCKGTPSSRRTCRDVQLPDEAAAEIQALLASLALRPAKGTLLMLDPAHVRRKFYERAEAAGLPRELGAPEVIRRSRAVELMQGRIGFHSVLANPEYCNGAMTRQRE